MLYLITNLKYFKGSDTYKTFAQRLDISVDTLQSYMYERRSPTINVVVKMYECFKKDNIDLTLDDLIFKNLSEILEKSKGMR